MMTDIEPKRTCLCSIC